MINVRSDDPTLVTYRCEACRGLFVERRNARPKRKGQLRYCPGCFAEAGRVARAARTMQPEARRRGITPAILRPPRGGPRKG